jgi:hypothetical protein
MFDSTISRRAVLAGITGLAATPLLAQTTDASKPRYAVMSIIGDKITLIGYRQPTGSNLDQNDKRILTVSGPALDNSTLLSVDDAVKRQTPQAETTLLAARDPKVYQLQDQSFDNPPSEAAAAVAAIKALLQQTKADRLILVAPFRSEARFALRETFIGTGKIAGLGVYVDRISAITVTATGEDGEGFIAPYAYFTLSLIDGKSLSTIRRKVVLESELVPTAAVRTATVPWDVLSNQKKIEMLEMLVRRGIDKALPELLVGA